jgi:hypothetical protein
MYEAAAFDIKTPEKGAFGHVTKSGDPDMTDRALAGPVHPGQSAGQISQISNRSRKSRTGARSSARLQRKGTPRRRLAPRRQEPYENFRDALNRLQDGREYCFAG